MLLIKLFNSRPNIFSLSYLDDVESDKFWTYNEHSKVALLLGCTTNKGYMYVQ